MTYEKMLQERASIKSWVAREENAILDLNREISKHLGWLDIYEKYLKQLEEDILRYETE